MKGVMKIVQFNEFRVNLQDESLISIIKQELDDKIFFAASRIPFFTSIRLLIIERRLLSLINKLFLIECSKI